MSLQETLIAGGQYTRIIEACDRSGLIGTCACNAVTHR